MLRLVAAHQPLEKVVHETLAVQLGRRKLTPMFDGVRAAIPHVNTLVALFRLPLSCDLSIVVGKGENGCGLIAAGGQTIEFSQFKVDFICLPHISALWFFYYRTAYSVVLA